MLKTSIRAVLAYFLVSSAQVSAQAQLPLVPYPTSIIQSEGDFQLNAETRILCSSASLQEARWFSSWLEEATGIPYKPVVEAFTAQMKNVIWVSCGEKVEYDRSAYQDLPENIRRNIEDRPQEAYKLVVSKDFIFINAEQAAGVFYGFQTLRQLLPVEFESAKGVLPSPIPCLVIDDKPKFQHRGLNLDCCRHFMSKELIIKYIDLLALHKMNILHWHLTDDQGWRIEILKYPKLTEIGAWRTENDGSKHGGYYSQQDIKEIVAYAGEHHVTIIPEIEMPGHSVAAIASYPFLSCIGDTLDVENEWGVFKDIFCVGQESTFDFLEGVLDEVCALFPGPYIHIGGDESPRFRWEHCEKCQKRMKDEHFKSEIELQSYLNKRVSTYLKSKNKTIIGWDEILEGEIPETAVVQSWRGLEGGIKAVSLNHKAIMSPTSHCYFDYSIEKTDMAHVYGFDPIPGELLGGEAAKIIGSECNMWTEWAPEEKVDSKVFPRLLAMSEVLWTYPEDRNIELFSARADDYLGRLDALNVAYGFPTYPSHCSTTLIPGSGISLTLATRLKESLIQYRFVDLSQTNPPAKWQNFDRPILLNQDSTIEFLATWRGRTFEPTMKRSFAVHQGLGKKITLSHTPSPSYLGGGPDALVNGIKGNSNFRNGHWQAVQGKDMEAVIDLGGESEIHEIKCDWYHYTNAWIFRPSSVEFYGSADGVKWERIKIWLPLIKEDEPGEIAVTASTGSIEATFRYLKVKALNNGACPKWHDAPGEPSWLFCDEIEIR